MTIFGRKKSSVAAPRVEEKYSTGKEYKDEECSESQDDDSCCDDLVEADGVLNSKKLAGKFFSQNTGIKTKPCTNCGGAIPDNAVRCFSCHCDQPVDPLAVNRPISVIRDNRLYKLFQISLVDEEDPSCVFSQTIFKLKDKTLISALSGYANLTNRPSKKRPKKYRYWVTGRELVIALPNLRARIPIPQSLQALIDEVELIRKRMIEEIDVLLARKKIVSDALWYIFEAGAAISGKIGDFQIGAVIKRANYQGNAFFGQDSFSINGSVINTDGTQFFYMDQNFAITSFGGVKNLSELPVQLLTKKNYKALAARGKIFSRVGIKNHYMHYTGTLMRSLGIYTVKTRMVGRVMIDSETYNRKHLHDRTFVNSQGSGSLNQNLMTTLSKDEYWMCYPTLPGFSFSQKQWGLFHVADLHDIIFDDTAFNKLVLPVTKKALIKALVEDYRQGVELLQNITKKDDLKHLKKSPPEELDENIAEIAEVSRKAKLDPNSRLFTDIITGKGGGCIFLLHGSPGVGKTLTAEAVCEHLHIPLYSITVGELGTTPESLESNLQAILELSGLWGAGILLDEADIFLEKRSKKDILRNAMVGIFLRLLEYHNGVLFLTTNRLSCLDEAFSSRISVALHYHELSAMARAQIWDTFLQATLDPEILKGLDIEQLASFELNGRQIRSCVRLSCARARIEQTPLSMDHLLSTVHLTQDFRTQFVDEKQARKSRRRAKFENTVAVQLHGAQ